ncbi:MAG: type II toxin-antitoxin system RelB/DinJ family antitoxin [Victivallales bacterium]|nr:type II toxin-antitoxin system RelB/DinJ family antitoxin [Victivallales bacterium]
MSTVNFCVRLDEKVKRDAELVFAELGLSTTTAITIFLKQVIRSQAMPFALSLHQPTLKPETLAALREAEELAKPGNGKSFQTIEELRADWLS